MNNNILHRFSKLAIVCMTGLSLMACHETFEDKGVPTLEVTPESKELIFTETASQTITIKTNRDWKAYLESPKEWIELSKSEGSGDDQITVTVASGARQQSAILVIALYNQYGVMMSENITITRNGDGSPVHWFEFDYSAALTSSWQNGVTATANEVSWYINGMNTSTYGNIGFSYFNNAGGYIHNKTAIGTTITEIIVDLQEDADYKNIAVYAGAQVNPKSSEELLTGVLNGGLITFDIPTGCPYFTLQNTATGYLNIDGFEVSYDGELESVGDGGNTGGDGGSTGGDGGNAGDGATTKELFSMDDEALGITAALTTAQTATVNEIGFEFANLGYDTNFGTIYINRAAGGYIVNTTPFSTDIASVCVTSNSYVTTNLIVMAGKTADSITETIAAGTTSGSGWATVAEYTIPTGTKFIKFVSNSASTNDAGISKITYNVKE